MFCFLSISSPPFPLLSVVLPSFLFLAHIKFLLAYLRFFQNRYRHPLGIIHIFFPPLLTSTFLFPSTFHSILFIQPLELNSSFSFFMFFIINLVFMYLHVFYFKSFVLLHYSCLFSFPTRLITCYDISLSHHSHSFSSRVSPSCSFIGHCVFHVF